MTNADAHQARRFPLCHLTIGRSQTPFTSGGASGLPIGWPLLTGCATNCTFRRNSSTGSFHALDGSGRKAEMPLPFENWRAKEGDSSANLLLRYSLWRILWGKELQHLVCPFGKEIGPDPAIPKWTAAGLTTTRKSEQNGKRGSSSFAEISAGHRGSIPDVPGTGGSRKDRWHAIFFGTPISWMPSAVTILLMARFSSREIAFWRSEGPTCKPAMCRALTWLA